jgi:hypothetical protein
MNQLNALSNRVESMRFCFKFLLNDCGLRTGRGHQAKKAGKRSQILFHDVLARILIAR